MEFLSHHNMEHHESQQQCLETSFLDHYLKNFIVYFFGLRICVFYRIEFYIIKISIS